MTVSSKLFQPFKVGANLLQHRVVMGPMTRVRATVDNIPTDIMVEYYRQRATAPGTLIVTEGTFIAERAGGMAGVPGIWSQAQIDAWKKVSGRRRCRRSVYSASSKITHAVHAKESFIWLQVSMSFRRKAWLTQIPLQVAALGRSASPDALEKKGFPYVGVSAIQHPERTVPPRPLTIPEIKEYVELFGVAARNAIAAGFDGVEIHGANGYLVDQFLQTNTNERTDEYGGSIENRIRFAVEVVDAIVDAVGAERTAIRLSPWSVYQSELVRSTEKPPEGCLPAASDMCMPDPIPTFEALVKRVDAKHPDLGYIHVVEADKYGEKAVAPGVVRSNDFIDAVRLPRPVIHCGGFKRDSALKAAEKNGVVVAFANHFIGNPDLVARLEKDVALNEADPKTFYGGGVNGYSDYPFA
jgi:NADPH2 dehydrogenase